MTDPERNQVLKMIEDGKISPEEGLKLMQALDQSSTDEAAAPAQVSLPRGEAVTASQVHWKAEPSDIHTEPSGMEMDARIRNVKDTVQRLWQIPLWIGILITVLSAAGMYAILRGPGTNFWFFFMVLPLLFGVAVIALAVTSHKARWIFVDVQQKAGEHPQRIFLGFPLPLKFAAWVMRTFRQWIPPLDREMTNHNVDEIITLVESGLGGEPLIVNVDEGESGEKVRVFIG
jgi:hypothetical protein